MASFRRITRRTNTQGKKELLNYFLKIQDEHAIVRASRSMKLQKYKNYFHAIHIGIILKEKNQNIAL